MLRDRQILAAIVSVSFATLSLVGEAGAVPTIVAIPAPTHDPNPNDAFELATITSESPPTIGSYESSNGDVFGRTDTTYPGEQGHLVFQSTGVASTFFVEFNTSAPIDLAGFSLYPWQAEPQHYRVPDSFTLFARLTPGPFETADLVSTTAIHVPFTDPPAMGGYGSGTIRVSDQFAKSARYFRFEVTAPAGVENGPRLLELDAVTSDRWVSMGADYNWNVRGNWEKGTIPNGVGASATIIAPVYEPVLIGTSVILSTLNANPAFNTSLVLAGSGSLKMDGGSGDAYIGLAMGAHRIELPLTLASNTQIVPSVMGSSLRIAGPLTIAGGTAISIHGSQNGSVTFDRDVSATGPATIHVTSTIFNANGDLGQAVNVHVNSGTVNFASTQHLAGLGALAGSVRLANGKKLIRAGSIAMTGTSNLDLKDGRLIIDYASPTLPPTEYVRSQVASGYAGGNWIGSGIRSSTAANDTRLGIGVVEASSIGSEQFTFAGEIVDQTTTLAALTLKGDTDLDFTVTFDDLLSLAQRYQSAGTWRNGDSDYDGDIDFDDLLALAQNYNQPLSSTQWNELSPGFAADVMLAFSVVPEPGIIGLALFGVIRGRRWR